MRSPVSALVLTFGKALGSIGADQCVDNGSDIAVKNTVKGMQRQSDTVIGQTPLGIVVG
jgi:hypothetical protein